ICAIRRFMHVAMFDVHAIKVVNKILILHAGADFLVYDGTNFGPQHTLIMITHDKSDLVGRIGSELAQRFKKPLVPTNNTADLIHRYTLSDNREKVAFIVSLQEIKNVAI